MTQIFHPATNTIAKASIFGSIIIIGSIVWLTAIFARSPYITQVGVAREQPIFFSHKHHVDGLGIDCRYCHTSVENSSFAGIPPLSTCMNCHSVMWNQAPILEPLRQKFKTNEPLEWNRVHDLPDFVYFDHSIHVKKGVGCVTCHGQVDKMPLTWRVQTLHMEWCLSCHRNPEPFLRPREEVFNMNWAAPKNAAQLRGKLMKEYHVQKKVNCSVCHR